ncbi:putative D-alanine--poly(phosphoribitol) ligase subunit 1 [Candidatus Terasakiella magnetica]|nr:putative D-alanine--poly(phosphoribitol) ligase subunit 1 [Candidatus Terasakiella magnetica]
MTPAPVQDVVERLVRRAYENPQAPAVVERGRTVSYADFAALAAGLAERLTPFGPHPRVAILLPQGAEAYAAMFGTLLAGGYYLPCNTASVAAKTRAAIDAFCPDVVVSAPEWRGPLALGTAVAVIDGWEPAVPPPSPHPSHRLAYVIFTSGSTGSPKGVMISRPALNHFTDWALAAIDPGPGDRWSQHPNIGFDLSVLDIFGALCSGAALYPLQGETDRMLPGRFIAANGLTIWNSVPSVLDMMGRAGDLTAARLASLRLLTFCGEPLYAAQVAAVFKANPAAVIQNTYGPTECTVSCTAITLTAADFQAACDDTVALGDAIPGMALHLVADEAGSEIAISGPQVADGYWDDAARTAEAFRTAPDGARAYFTGDLIRRRGPHTFFQRRRDTQIKLRGYRLELDEINAAVRASGITAAATVLVAGKLHCFIVSPGAPDLTGLRAELERRLDPHAVPSYIHRVAALPRNANDKVDLAALERLAPTMEPT